MVVKSKTGRKRYIVFRIEADINITKGDLISTLNSIQKPMAFQNIPELEATGPNNDVTQPISGTESNQPEKKGIIKLLNRSPWVIGIKNNYGLVRCHHKDKEKTIELLQSIDTIGRSKKHVKIITLGTTGTIKSARKKYLDKLNIYPFEN
jgi:RNase P/RNase MRP subunit POP5